MNPAPQLRGPLTTVAALSCMTTNAGRFWFSVPRPYVTHEPRHGRPARIEQVFIRAMPAEWLIPSPQQDRRIARSSAHAPMCGNQSDTGNPLCPYCVHFRGEASNGDPISPIAVITLPK